MHRLTAPSRYDQNIRELFDSTAEVFYEHWGEFFHLAIFAAGDEHGDLAGA